MHKILDHYPEAAAIIAEEDIENTQRFLADTSMAELTEWTRERTVTLELGGRAFRMLVDRPKDGNEDKLVVVGGEFGNGLSEAVSARARVIRDTVDPDATLIVQPNSTLTENNHNFSRDELSGLWHGEMTPIVDRLRHAVEVFGDPDDITLAGPSQGATGAAAYAGRDDTPAANLSVVEGPNTHARSRLSLLADFAGSGANLKNNIRLNFGNEQDPFLNELTDGLSLPGMAKYGLGLTRAQNIALSGIMRTDKLSLHMHSTLYKGGGVVQAWGVKDKVSGDEANARFAEAFEEDYTNFEAFRFAGEHADHSLTNVYVLMGALARRAAELNARNL